MPRYFFVSFFREDRDREVPIFRPGNSAFMSGTDEIFSKTEAEEILSRQLGNKPIFISNWVEMNEADYLKMFDLPYAKIKE